MYFWAQVVLSIPRRQAMVCIHNGHSGPARSHAAAVCSGDNARVKRQDMARPVWARRRRRAFVIEHHVKDTLVAVAVVVMAPRHFEVCPVQSF